MKLAGAPLADFAGAGDGKHAVSFAGTSATPLSWTGWALYSESLGETRLYPIHLEVRAAQLRDVARGAAVVDTGDALDELDAREAIQFFKDNTGKTDQDITVEVDGTSCGPAGAGL